MRMNLEIYFIGTMALLKVTGKNFKFYLLGYLKVTVYENYKKFMGLFPEIYAMLLMIVSKKREHES